MEYEMKAVLIASVLLVALVLSIPLIFVAPSLDIPTPSPPAPSETAAVTPQITITIPKPSPFEAVQAPATEVADRAVIALSRRGEIISLSMKDYLAGVVAAEMPASFNL